MISRLPALDLVVPHLFCVPGMTSFRAFFEDILRIPVVGSPAHSTALAANKAHTRHIVSGAGVRVARGEQLSPGDPVSFIPPVIVKPNSEDNSLGLTLVQDPEQMTEALQVAFERDTTVLVEEYIPGREIRVGVVDYQGQLFVPSMIEYLVSPEHPIRTTVDKYTLNPDGTPEKQPENPAVPSMCPAVVDSLLKEKLATAAKQAHLALGCRDYSLYDFRIHHETQEPYFLEAGLFWSFGEISMISRMLMADGVNLRDIIKEIWQRAAARQRA
jgi:D-alanine-D-alanine ligase